MRSVSGVLLVLTCACGGTVVSSATSSRDASLSDVSRQDVRHQDIPSHDAGGSDSFGLAAVYDASPYDAGVRELPDSAGCSVAAIPDGGQSLGCVVAACPSGTVCAMCTSPGAPLDASTFRRAVPVRRHAPAWEWPRLLPLAFCGLLDA